MEKVDRVMDKRELLRAIEGDLTSQERLVIQKRFGLEGKKEETQRQIAKSMGISRSYVSRIEKRALEKLQRKMNRFD